MLMKQSEIKFRIGNDVREIRSLRESESKTFVEGNAS